MKFSKKLSFLLRVAKQHQQEEEENAGNDVIKDPSDVTPPPRPRPSSAVVIRSLDHSPVRRGAAGGGAAGARPPSYVATLEPYHLHTQNKSGGGSSSSIDRDEVVHQRPYNDHSSVVRPSRKDLLHDNSQDAFHGK